jgi:hypothetical protein
MRRRPTPSRFAGPPTWWLRRLLGAPLLIGALLSCSDSAPPPADTSVDRADMIAPDSSVDFGIADIAPRPDQPPAPAGPWIEAQSFTSVDLLEAAVIARDDIWIVGDKGEIWHYDGVGYSKAGSPLAATARLFTVACRARTDCWAAGREGPQPSDKMVLLRYDGSWRVLPSSTDETFGCIRLIGGDYFATTTSGRAVKRHDGERWAAVWQDLSGAVNTFCLGGTASDNIFVGGSVLTPFAGGSTPRPFALHTQGAGWSVIALPSPGPELPELSQTTNLLAPWVVGGDEAWFPMGRMALLRYAQGKLSEALLPGAAQGGVTTMMWGSSPADIWLIGSLRTPSGAQSRIFHYDGSAWTAHERTFDRAPRGIAGKRGHTAIIVGEDGLVLEYRP